MAYTTMYGQGDTITFRCRCTVGASGAHTLVWGPGISGVERTAAGKYKLTLVDPPLGPIIFARAQHWPQVDAEPLQMAPSEGTYVVGTAPAKTCSFEAWVIDETAAQTEIPSGDEVSYELVIARNAVASA